jgi:short-subunit dehydrogenase
MLATDFTSPVLLSQAIALRLAASQGSGTLAVIGSVAGDRGRQSNYAYGAAKGGLAVFLAGLRNRMFPRGVHVLTVKPGFVDTPMTAEVRKNALFATPDRVAGDILHAVARSKNEIYTPGYWRVIMAIIRAVPERIFKKLKL